MFETIVNILKFIFKKITKLSVPYFSLRENSLGFKITSEFIYIYDISNIYTKQRHDAFVLSAYTLKSDELYLEYIEFQNDVLWQQDAFGAFLNEVKDELKFTSFELLEKLNFSKYEFRTYKIDDEYILSFIHLQELHKDIFIVDKKMELYEKLIQNFKKDYSFRYKEYKKINQDFSFSLTKSNSFKNYFRITSS